MRFEHSWALSRASVPGLGALAAEPSPVVEEAIIRFANGHRWTRYGTIRSTQCEGIQEAEGVFERRLGIVVNSYNFKLSSASNKVEGRTRLNLIVCIEGPSERVVSPDLNTF